MILKPLMPETETLPQTMNNGMLPAMLTGQRLIQQRLILAIGRPMKKALLEYILQSIPMKWVFPKDTMALGQQAIISCKPLEEAGVME